MAKSSHNGLREELDNYDSDAFCQLLRYKAGDSLLEWMREIAKSKTESDKKVQMVEVFKKKPLLCNW